MCYDISYTEKLNKIASYFTPLKFDFEFYSEHVTGHSYQPYPVIVKDEIKLMEWGVIPFYTTDEKKFLLQRANMLNARSERILDDTKSYWHKIRNRRCLIPVTGFYEHREVKGLKKKAPYLIGLKNQDIFFFPGLYSAAELPDLETGEVIKRWTFTIITRPANSVMKQIHNSGANPNRMPLMLPLEMSKEFLGELTEERYREILNYQMPSEELTYHPVYTIRSPKGRPDGKPKTEFWQWENLPEII